ncbi:MAG TPA: histidine kinase dimerization/phospho-acceptor domain-containing protein, partial [Bryobacteraceae bacterium]
MTPPKEWLRPPRSLLLILFLLTLISVSTVAWFGWKLLEQERVVEAQRAQERLEQVGDRLAATLRGTLAETGERLSAWLANPPSDGKPEEGLLLILNESTLSAYPADRLLYRPFRSPEPEAPAGVFADGEELEFLQAQPAKAAEWYQRLADSKTPEVRAGALMRLGRVWRKMGRTDESRTAYTRLAAVEGVKVAGAPSELVARLALCELVKQRSDAEALKADLLRGRWHLTRGQFEFYWSETSRLASGASGLAEPAPAESVILSEAAALVWNGRGREQGPRGQETVWVDGHPFFLIWRAVASRRAVLVMRPDSLLKPIPPAGEVFIAAVDSEGRVLAGRKDGSGRAAVRTAAESQLPWTLYVTGARSLREAGTVARQRYLLLGTAVMVLFLIAGTYFIGRAIRREMEVSRMQSDFVSAVSHEFRSPLTSMRQLSEILALGRVPSEERRQVYYETLVNETVRLQRLVESLLNFGRMEARARQYRFEELDA